MLVAGPFLIPLFLFAVFLVAVKSQYQAIIVMLAAPYVWDTRSFLLVVVFSAVSGLWGHWRAAASGGR